MKNYVLLAGYPLDYDSMRDDNHFYIHMAAADQDYSAAVNVESESNAAHLHYITAYYALPDLLASLSLPNLPEEGLYREDAGELPHYIDYYEMDLFDHKELNRAAPRKPEKNDLLDTLEEFTEKALKEPDAMVLAYGSLWGPKPRETDWTFGFTPAQGVHDIHCNQHSPEGSRFRAFDVKNKDGALFFLFPEENTAIGIFTIFL